MHYGNIGPICRPLSRVVLGTGSIGNIPGNERERLFDAYRQAGGSVIDTAAVYGGGATETAVGRWLARTGCRDEVAIVTKGGHPSLPDWAGRLTPEQVSLDLAASRERLQVDRIDLYMLHRYDEEVPVGEIMSMLGDHVRSGAVNAVGVSNWTWQRVEQANTYAARLGLPGLCANSIHYSLAVPQSRVAPGTVSLCGDSEALSWYRASRLPLLSWSSLARGFLSGRFSPSVHSDAHVERIFYHPSNWERLQRVRKLAADRRCTPSQVALAWVLCQPLDLYAVVGPTQLPHLEECLGAADLHLSPPDLAWLNLEADEPVEPQEAPHE